MKTDIKTRARSVYRILARAYPDAACALRSRNPFELLVAVVLSAQCTDKKVNAVLPNLFVKFPRPGNLAAARITDVEKTIRSLGLYKAKAKAIREIARLTGGRVPRTMGELTRLPGVGRKTANVVLSNAFSLNEGIAVDTHCKRLSRLLGFSREKTPERIEEDLVKLFPRRDWGMVTHLLISHGRVVCRAGRPECGKCVLARLCPSSKIVAFRERDGVR